MQKHISSKFITAHPKFGLGNRLLCISSCWCLAKRTKKNIALHCIPEYYHFYANFDDLFNHNITTYPQGQLIECYDIRVENNYFGEHIAQGFGICSKKDGLELTNFFKNLKPKSPAIETINQYLLKYNFREMVGVHIRQGDKNSGDRFNFLYIRAMKYILKLDPNITFFLSTDNHEIESIFLKEFPNKIIFFEKKHLNRNYEGQIEAIIDMWLLSYTKLILGGIGTFSVCASKIRNTNFFNVINPYYPLFPSWVPYNNAPPSLEQIHNFFNPSNVLKFYY